MIIHYTLPIDSQYYIIEVVIWVMQLIVDLFFSKAANIMPQTDSIGINQKIK